jgi:hypothetical protein
MAKMRPKTAIQRHGNCRNCSFGIRRQSDALQRNWRTQIAAATNTSGIQSELRRRREKTAAIAVPTMRLTAIQETFQRT